jgi:hypothetical protein
MDLDRNINSDGKGKYALINLRKIEGNPQTAEELAAAILKNPEAVEFGRVGEQDEFFVIKLKDFHADAALYAYVQDIRNHGDSSQEQYALQVEQLGHRAGVGNPFCKKPD